MSNEANHTTFIDTLPFMAFVTNAADLATLKEFSGTHQWDQGAIQQGDIRTAIEFLKSHPSPSLLLVEIPSAEETPALLDALADVCLPGTKVLVSGTVNEYSFYCWLVDMGISSYLLKPLTVPMLEGAYIKSVQPPVSTAKEDKQPGKVIVVLGTRGGVGATTVALNLAGVCAELSPKPVALVDVDPQLGSVALGLDIEPSRGMREALEKPDRIDQLFFDRVMVKPHKNLSVLGAEEALHDRLHVHEQAPEMLLKELRDKFAIVVLDVPRHLDAITFSYLKLADHVLIVTEMTLLSLRDALRLNDTLRDGLKLKSVRFIANRVGLAPKIEMQAADYEKAINGTFVTSIPFSPEVFMQISNDIPAVKMKQHASIKPLYDLVEKLLPDLKPKKTAQASKKFSLFKGK